MLDTSNICSYDETVMEISQDREASMTSELAQALELAKRRVCWMIMNDPVFQKAVEEHVKQSLIRIRQEAELTANGLKPGFGDGVSV